MSEHEKDLLIVIAFPLAWAGLGIGIALVVLDRPFLALLKSFQMSGLTIALFGLLGLGAALYELTTLSRAIQVIEAEDEEWPVKRSNLTWGGTGLIVALLLFGLVSYIVNGRNIDSLLRFSYMITLTGFGFSLMFGMMFVGAFLARLKRK